MPPEARFPTPFRPVAIRFGKPVTVDRYTDRANDRLLLRQIIDEVMFAIREMSGQEYVNSYATKKAEALPAEVAQSMNVRRGRDVEIPRRPLAQGGRETTKPAKRLVRKR